MSNNIPVNGWPQLKDLEAVQPTLDRLDKIEAWKRTVKEETFTGDDITIENALALPARSLITEIEPIQDLHGYDKPWVGGAGKNKLPLILSDIKAANTDGTWSDNVYTINGGTITILTDSDGNVTGIKANGTFNASVTFVIAYYNCFLAANTYIFGAAQHSNDSYGGANNHYYFLSNVNGTSSWVAASHLGLSIRTFDVTDPTKGIRCGFYIESGVSINNELSYPMIRLSSVTDDLFAPYSNICPISGRTAAVITRSDGDEISEDFTIQLGQTVYGGTLNVTTGVMTVNTKIEDMGNLTYNYNSANNVFGTALISDMADVDTSRVQVISSVLKGLPAKDLAGIVAADDNSIAFNSVNASKFMRIKCTTYTDGTAIKTAFTGQKICYELANPTTIQLTPTEVQMLKGYNRVSLSDGYGTIELKALTGANWS